MMVQFEILWKSIIDNSLNITSSSVLNSPVGDAAIVSEFLAKRDCTPCSNEHGGTDYAVQVGTPVLATADGVVSRSYFSNSYGNTVIINHGTSISNENMNVYTLYAHGKSRLVGNGEMVKMGQTILSSGNTGNTTGPHLHYEVIETHFKPHQKSFYGNLKIRRAPSELGGLINK